MHAHTLKRRSQGSRLGRSPAQRGSARAPLLGGAACCPRRQRGWCPRPSVREDWSTPPKRHLHLRGVTTPCRSAAVVSGSGPRPGFSMPRPLRFVPSTPVIASTRSGPDPTAQAAVCLPGTTTKPPRRARVDPTVRPPTDPGCTPSNSPDHTRKPGDQTPPRGWGSGGQGSQDRSRRSRGGTATQPSAVVRRIDDGQLHACPGGIRNQMEVRRL